MAPLPRTEFLELCQRLNNIDTVSYDYNTFTSKNMDSEGCTFAIVLLYLLTELLAALTVCQDEKSRSSTTSAIALLNYWLIAEFQYRLKYYTMYIFSCSGLKCDMNIHLLWATKVVETLLENGAFRYWSTCSILFAYSANFMIPRPPNSM